MRHRNAFQKLSRTAAHRRALLRNLATNLVLKDRIVTTLPKAKELKRVADKLVTLGKTDNHHNRRQAMAYLFAINRKETGNKQKLSAVHRLFTEVAPRYTERHGGYTRVVKLGKKRPGDNAPMAVIEFVERELKSKTKPARRTRKKAEPAAEAAPATE